jgi:succinate-acetate transporter protein
VDTVHIRFLRCGPGRRKVSGSPILAVLFWLLLLAFLLLDGMVIGKVPAPVAGWEIFIVGLLAWYIAMATLANTVYKRKVLPLS